MAEEKFNNHKKWWMFPGRWQPLHKGHMAIINQALKEGKNVWIALRDTEISEKNPYTINQRLEMIKRAYKDFYGERIIASVIPDIEGIRYGRGVGYKVEQVEVPKEIEQISATKIRAGKSRAIHEEVNNYLTLLKSTIWFTGLPCSGKTTLADRLKEEIDNLNKGYICRRLDGDDIRGKLNADLGFSEKDRKENLRRVAYLARYENENGGMVLATFVSPTNEMREEVRNIIGKENMKLIYVKCSLEECERRDVKGMYAKARKGEIKQFTGISASFEEPTNPDLIINTEKKGLEECVRDIIHEFRI